jgi:Rrf2 family protein
MQLSRATSYAVEALAHMAAGGPEKLFPSHDVARAHGIPERFLLKVLKPLVGARVLYSLRGPHGGYRLAKPANKITLLEVVEAAEGPLLRFTDQGEGNRGVAGRLAGAFGEAAEAARRVLSRVTLADLAGGRKGR